MPVEQMLEAPARQRFLPAGGAGHDADDPSVGSATVASNLYWEDLPVDGMTVEQIRSQYREMLNIDSNARPVLDGLPVDESTVVRTGQQLIFQRVTGEKG